MLGARDDPTRQRDSSLFVTRPPVSKDVGPTVRCDAGPYCQGVETSVRPRAGRAVHTRTPLRLAFLLPGGLALVAGLDAALTLLGLPAPVDSLRLAEAHGLLMVLGFVGTVVALERAVALGRAVGYAVPAALGLGAVTTVLPLPDAVGRVLFVLGTAGLCGLYRVLWARQPALAVAVEALGAGLALGAAVLWAAGVDVPYLAPWLAVFLVLTIAGERLELARVGMLRGRVELTVVALGLTLAASVVLALVAPRVGYPVLGATLLALVVVLARHDVARRTVRATGLPRYMAACLLAGYGWLAVAGTIWLVGGPIYSGRGYDAVLHAVFLGFVITMIMAHAPVILPAVLRRPLPYHPVMYGPFALLQLSLAVRLLVGDGYDVPAVVQVAGVVNIVALLAFVGVVVVSVARGERRA